MPCPDCSATISRASDVCSECGHDFTAITQRPRPLEHVGFGLRFFAWIIDTVILTVAQLVIGLTVRDQLTASVIGGLFGLAYTVGFWTLEGATPGKMLLGLRVLSADGQPIGPGQAFVRYLGYIVCGLTLGVGYLMIIFNDEKRGLHDLIARTIVVHGDTIPVATDEPQVVT